MNMYRIGAISVILLVVGTGVSSAQQAGEHVLVIQAESSIMAGTKILETVNPGTTLLVREVRGDWLAVTHSKSGWIHRRNILPADHAVQHLTDAISKNAKDAKSYFLRGMVWTAKREFNNAIADFSEAIRLRPKSAATYAHRAIAWKGKGEYQIAIGDYCEAIRLRPNAAVTYHNRGQTYALMGNYKKAMTDFRESIRLAPENYDGYNALAWWQAVCPDAKYRDGDQAVVNARKACQLCGHGHWHCLGTLAAAYAETGEFDEALRWARKSLEAAPKHRLLRVREQIASYQQGQPYRHAAELEDDEEIAQLGAMP